MPALTLCQDLTQGQAAYRAHMPEAGGGGLRPAGEARVLLRVAGSAARQALFMNPVRRSRPNTGSCPPALVSPQHPAKAFVKQT